MLLFIFILAGICAIFAAVLFIHSGIAVREQQALAAAFVRASAERKSYAAVNWPETVPDIYHRGAQ